MVQWADALQYAALVTNTCYAYYGQPDLQQLIISLVDQVNQRPAIVLQRGILLGSLEDMLELAMRSYSACGASPNDYSPYTLLQNITDSTQRGLAARVFSFLAHVYFETRHGTDITRVANIDAIYYAADMANKAAALGFISPVVLFIANTIEDLGYRRRADCRHEGDSDFNRFEKLEDLWRVHDKRKAEVSRAEETREKKMQAEPLSYVCAAKGCGLQGTRRTGLQHCGGKCSKQWKPAYCSRDCQKKDWPRHKPFCRFDGASDDYVVSLHGPARIPMTTATTQLRKAPELGFLERSAKEMESRKYERKIRVAGLLERSLHIASSTMDAALMKELKTAFEKEDVAGSHADMPVST